MNAHRMDQETVERLLGGPVVDPQDGPEALVRLLTAVRVAPRPAELSGEDAAMRAYRLARAGTAAPLAGRRTAFAGLLSLKAALAALALTATGGVALAAANGALPGPLGGSEADVVTSAPATALPSATGAPSGQATTSTGGPDGPSPSAALVGLCRAYRADAGDNPGRTLENPVFSGLIAAAGGRDKVADYCDRVLDGNHGRPGGPASDRPGARPTDKPGRPSGAPSGPAGKPTTPAGPAGKPTTPATGQDGTTTPDQA